MKGASGMIFILRMSQLCRHVIDALYNGLKHVGCDTDQYHSSGDEFKIIGVVILGELVLKMAITTISCSWLQSLDILALSRARCFDKMIVSGSDVLCFD